jgi:hypothetical protein
MSGCLRPSLSEALTAHARFFSPEACPEVIKEDAASSHWSIIDVAREKFETVHIETLINKVPDPSPSFAQQQTSQHYGRSRTWER